MDDSRTPRRGRFWAALVFLAKAALPVLVLAGAVALTQWMIASRPEVTRRAPRETAYPVETIEVGRAANVPTLSVYGEIVPAARVELRALVGGEVVSIDPKLAVGGLVQKGEVLLTVDDFAYEGALTAARANLAEAKAQLTAAAARVALKESALAQAGTQLDLATRDLDRADRLVGKGAVTEQAVDQRRLTVSQRRQALDQLSNEITIEKAGIEQQKAALDRLEWRVREAERNLSDTSLKAPFDAIVVSETVEVGRMVNASDVAVTLDRLDAVDAEFTLSDTQYGALVADGGKLLGREIAVIWQTGAIKRRYSAIIDRIGAEISAIRGGVQVYARVTGDGSVPLPRPGAFVEVELPGPTYQGSIRLASEALFDGDHVFVVRGGRLERRNVKVLARDGGSVIVDGELGASEHVLATRVPGAGEGVLVDETVLSVSPEPSTARALGTSVRQ